MSIVEITGFVFGIAGIWLTIREHWSCFPVGLVNVCCSLWLFFDQKLYSDTVQQGVYILLLTYGWYSWNHHASETRPRIGFMNTNMKLYLLAGLLALSAGMGYFFDRFTDADVPYTDAAATALSFTAQFLIARKKIENWLIWMAVNGLYIGIYTYKELYLYAILFALYFILSIKGFSTWKRTMEMQKQLQ